MAPSLAGYLEEEAVKTCALMTPVPSCGKAVLNLDEPWLQALPLPFKKCAATG